MRELKITKSITNRKLEDLDNYMINLYDWTYEQMKLILNKIVSIDMIKNPTADELVVQNRLKAQLIIWKTCPEYFALFEKGTAGHFSDDEKMTAKQKLLEARYPKFYKAFFEETD